MCGQKLANEPVEIIFRNTYYIYQGVTAGLSYLHEKKLVHGDIKGIDISKLRVPKFKVYTKTL